MRIACALLVLVFAAAAAAQGKLEYGAIAVEEFENKKRKRGAPPVRFGVNLWASSPEGAQAAALKQCSVSEKNPCKIVKVFNGCYFIATGSNALTGEHGWGHGETESSALEDCEKQGLKCKQLSGGCVRK